MIFRLLTMSVLMMTAPPPSTDEQLVAHAREEVLKHWGLVGTGNFAKTRNLRPDYVKQIVCCEVAIPERSAQGGDAVVWTPFVIREDQSKLEIGRSAVCP